MRLTHNVTVWNLCIDVYIGCPPLFSQRPKHLELHNTERPFHVGDALELLNTLVVTSECHLIRSSSPTSDSTPRAQRSPSAGPLGEVLELSPSALFGGRLQLHLNRVKKSELGSSDPFVDEEIRGAFRVDRASIV